MNIPITFEREEFENEYSHLPLPSDALQLENEIKSACRTVWLHIVTNSTLPWQKTADDNKLTEKQLDVLKTAAMEQYAYELDNGGSFARMSGYDSINNTMISKEDIRKRIISPLAEDLLKRNGFYYKGVGY